MQKGVASFASPFLTLKQIKMLNSLETLEVAEVVNEKVNLPFLGEKSELILFHGIISSIDVTLYKEGFESSDFIKNASEGITKEEKEEIVSFWSSKLNKIVGLPGIGERQEELLLSLAISAIVDIVMNRLKGGNSTEVEE